MTSTAESNKYPRSNLSPKVKFQYCNTDTIVCVLRGKCICESVSGRYLYMAGIGSYMVKFEYSNTMSDNYITHVLHIYIYQALIRK